MKGRVRKTAFPYHRRVLHFLEHCAAVCLSQQDVPQATTHAPHPQERGQALRGKAKGFSPKFFGRRKLVFRRERPFPVPLRQQSFIAQQARQPPGIRGRQVVFPLRVISRDGLNRMEGGRKHCGFHERQNLFEPDFPLLPIEAGGLIRKADQPFQGRNGGCSAFPRKGREPGPDAPGIYLFPPGLRQRRGAETTVDGSGHKTSGGIQQFKIRRDGTPAPMMEPRPDMADHALGYPVEPPGFYGQEGLLIRVCRMGVQSRQRMKTGVQCHWMQNELLRRAVERRYVCVQPVALHTNMPHDTEQGAVIQPQRSSQLV